MRIKSSRFSGEDTRSAVLCCTVCTSEAARDPTSAPNPCQRGPGPGPKEDREKGASEGKEIQNASPVTSPSSSTASSAQCAAPSGADLMPGVKTLSRPRVVLFS